MVNFEDMTNDDIKRFIEQAREEIKLFNFSNQGEYFMSKGLDIIGQFNPDSMKEVDQIKQKAIELIDLIEEYGKCRRRQELAIDQIESGTMFGVKSLFHHNE